MFSDVNLIVVGDSFVFGHLGDDIETESCHKRSWVGKLGRIGNFKSNTNLGAPGGSNDRSVRVLLDHIEKTYSPAEKYLVIFCISEITRLELAITGSDAGAFGVGTQFGEFDSSTVEIAGLGHWSSTNLFGGPCLQKDKLKEFLDSYYQLFAHEEYLEKMLTHKMFMLKSVLDSLNINCLFASTIAPPELLRGLKFFGKTLPIIEFGNTNIISFLGNGRFETQPCGHYKENAYEFLANYIHYRLKEKGWNTKT